MGHSDLLLNQNGSFCDSPARSSASSGIFFYESCGGSDNGDWHLLDANLDWGLTNLPVKNWLDECVQRVGKRDPVYLSLFGVDYGMRMDDLGLQGEPIPMKLDPDTQMNKSLPIKELSPGLYAISVNHLHAYRHHQTGEPDCSEFLQLKPIAIVGSAVSVQQHHLPIQPA